MPFLHGVVAGLAAVNALVLSVALIFPAVRRRGVDVLAVLTLATVVEAGVAAGLGLLLVGGGHRAHDPLHYLYAALAVVILPVGSVYGRWRQRPALYLGVAALLLAVLVIRLYATA